MIFSQKSFLRAAGLFLTFLEHEIGPVKIFKKKKLIATSLVLLSLK